MAEVRRGYSLGDVLAWLNPLPGAELANRAELGASESQIRVDLPAPLALSKPANIAFFFSREFESELPSAAPGILITKASFVKPLKEAGLGLWKTSAVVSCANPHLAMALISQKFAPGFSTVAHGERKPRAIHSTAVVSPAAEIGEGVQVGAYCVIEEGAKVGANSILYPHVYVGPGAAVGEACVFFPGVAIYEWVRIGNRVRIHANSTIGSDGFGYAVRTEDGKPSGHEKIYHLGRVIIGDDVEIGANTCVDRGTWGDTVISRMAKLDNQVHVAHNAYVDEGGILCGCVGLSGGAKVGKYAYVGGMAGLANNVVVGDGAKVAGMTLVSKDVPPGTTAVGNPQRDHREFFRMHAMLSRMLAEKRGAGDKKSDSPEKKKKD